jgi:hypothetical protein
MDVIFPIWSPSQPFENTLGALALYTVAFTVVTSYFRFKLGRKLWKSLHYAAYGAAALFFVHGLLTDPQLQNTPLDPFDAEKVRVELCLLAVVVGTLWRLRHALDRRKKVKFTLWDWDLAHFPEAGSGGQVICVLEGYLFNRMNLPAKLHRISMVFSEKGRQRVIGHVRDADTYEALEALHLPPRQGVDVSLYSVFESDEAQELLNLQRANFVGHFPDVKTFRKKLAGKKDFKLERA